ncbi:pentapeptide repeat-containing protein [Grimontia sp. SpTr1]|uniref:pentapeptide repeat-containing protein n=1 Tax=Grimontia sp. SpTr1 TaxID=2995319 RepID=UPI00248CF339|nr:pentapeptide repeat-containing protein [Grimontia sp. SpTr1]
MKKHVGRGYRQYRKAKAQRYPGLLHDIANSLDSWHMVKIASALSSFLLIFALWSFFEEKEQREIDRDLANEQRRINAWQLLTTKAPGNSGKREALEYLVTNGEPLRSINLQPVALSESSEFIGVYLNNVYIPKADLVGSSLIKAQLYYANLENANLRNTNFSGSSLNKATLKNALLVDANFSEVDFTGADLRNVDFSRANLENAVFWGADLRGAKFHNANLTGVRLREAKLQGADFRSYDDDDSFALEDLPLEHDATLITCNELNAGIYSWNNPYRDPHLECGLIIPAPTEEVEIDWGPITPREYRGP